MPSGSWNDKGVSIQSCDVKDAGYPYQSLYQPVKTYQCQQLQHQHQEQQIRDGFCLESHHFMDLSQVLKEVEDEGSLIPSPTKLVDRKRRLSDDDELLMADHDARNQHASIEQLRNTYSISLDSLNDNNIESAGRITQESCRIEYDSDKTPTVDRSFWSESDDDSPVVEGIESCYYDETDGMTYNDPPNIIGTALKTPTNLNGYLRPCDQGIEKEIRNIGVITDDFDLGADLVENYIDEQKSCSSQDATSSASSESLRSAYSLQTPALSSSPESYEMLYRSFEVAAMMEREHKKNGIDLSDPPEESSLDMLNKTSPKLQRMNYHRGDDQSLKGNSHESSPSPLPSSSRSHGAEANVLDQNAIKWYDQRPSTLDFGNIKAHSAEDISSSKVTTFAQLAQQRKKPESKDESKEQVNSQESLLHWTELLSIKGASSSAQDIPGVRSPFDSQEQLPEALRRPQSLPIQLRHLQKPTIRPHATPPQHPRSVTRTLSAPEGFSASHRTSKSWGEHDEGIGELSESETEDLSPDLVTQGISRESPNQSVPLLLRQDEIEFGSLTPRRHRTTTWCGSFSTTRRSLLDSREHLSDTDSLDAWQPQPTDINANIASNHRSPRESNGDSVSALYNARGTPLNTSLCRKNFRETVKRSRKRHYCKDTYAERMLQHGGVFISGTENKPFLLGDSDASKPESGAASATVKTRSLPRNLGVARRRSSTFTSKSGRSRPRSMEGLPSSSSGADTGTMASFVPLCKSKSQEDAPSKKWSGPLAASGEPTTGGEPTMANVSAVQRQWEASDAADYASLNSYLLGKSPAEQTRVTCTEIPSSGDESDRFQPASRRVIRIENVARDAEVKYIRHRPLKPIHVVDAEHHRKKVLERLSTLQPSSAPPTGVQPQDWRFFPHPTAATSVPPEKGHQRQTSDAQASAAPSQSRAWREGFWAWATAGRQPVRASNMNKMETSMMASECEAGEGRRLKTKLRPLNLKGEQHEDWDALDSMPPQVMRVSPRDEERERSTIDIMQKRALVAEVNAAVAQLLDHFDQAKAGQPKEKADLGDSWKTPDVGHLALHYLCPALMGILQDGLRPHSNSLLVGRIKNTTWTAVEATTQIGPGTRLLHELASSVSKDIRLKDSKLRTHAFFLGLLNIRCMGSWLEHIRTHPETIRRLYEPSAFFSLCNTAPYQQLFSDLLVAVQPLAVLPFNLDHGFEYGYIQAETMRQRERQQLLEQHGGAAALGSSLNTNSLIGSREQEGGSSTSGFPTVHLFGRAPRREGANSERPVRTGMYSSMTLMRNARKVTPLGRQESSEQPATHERLLRTVNSAPLEDVSGHELEGRAGPMRFNSQNSQSSRWSLGWIKEFATSVAAQQEKVPARSESTTQSSSKFNTWGGYQRSRSVDLQGSISSGTVAVPSSGWGKLGASFSKMWNQLVPSQTQAALKPVPSTPPPSPAVEEEAVRHRGDGQSLSRFGTPTSPKSSPGSPVKALCHHVSMTEGELCFSKGDVLTVNRQVDPDWLLCSHGNETGLVHIEYVQGVE